jgi:hypothetical protein
VLFREGGLNAEEFARLQLSNLELRTIAEMREKARQCLSGRLSRQDCRGGRWPPVS